MHNEITYHDPHKYYCRGHLSHSQPAFPSTRKPTLGLAGCDMDMALDRRWGGGSEGPALPE